MEEICKNCRNYGEFYDHENEAWKGECHRYPPTSFLILANEVHTFISKYPDVREYDWCGQFEKGNN